MRKSEQSFRKMLQPLGPTRLDEILELSQVLDTKQTSILFERNSVFSADGASGLTNDRAFITKHLGTAFEIGGPGFEMFTVMRFLAQRLFRLLMWFRREILTGI